MVNPFAMGPFALLWGWRPQTMEQWSTLLYLVGGLAPLALLPEMSAVSFKSCAATPITGSVALFLFLVAAPSLTGNDDFSVGGLICTHVMLDGVVSAGSLMIMPLDESLGFLMFMTEKIKLAGPVFGLVAGAAIRLARPGLHWVLLTTAMQALNYGVLIPATAMRVHGESMLPFASAMQWYLVLPFQASFFAMSVCIIVHSLYTWWQLPAEDEVDLERSPTPDSSSADSSSIGSGGNGTSPTVSEAGIEAAEDQDGVGDEEAEVPSGREPSICRVA